MICQFETQFVSDIRMSLPDLVYLISTAACADAMSMSESPPTEETEEVSPKSFEFPLSKDLAAKCG